MKTVSAREYKYRKVNVGDQVGRLTLIAKVGKTSNGSYIYECLCVCGNTKRVQSSSLNSGLVQSCGCLFKEVHSERLKTHGKSKIKDREYGAWIAMKSRCYNPNNEYFEIYGGRGITVCDEWLNSFETFFRDMGCCPDGFSLDRENPNKGYCKDNCRWASASLQARNKRTLARNKSGVSGVTFHSKHQKWQASITFKGKQTYLGLFENKEDAISARKNAEIKLNFYQEN